MKRVRGFLRTYKLFSLALAAGTTGLGLTLTHHAVLAHWLLGIVSLMAVVPLLWGMWQNVRSGAYGINLLGVTAIIASVLLGEYWAGLVVTLILTGGDLLENFAEHRAKREFDTLLARVPQKAHIIRKGKVVRALVNDIRIGDKLIIQTGELIPVDAKIIDGAASFDESSLTGESLPQTRQPGDRLLSGSVNLDGTITAQAMATAEHSQYQQIIKLVRSAAVSQAPFVRLADRYSLPFTFLAYALAIGVWLWSGQAVRFLEVVIVATPYPLLLAAPIALISGMSRASRYGVIVRTGSAFEGLAKAKTIAFNKTGILTRGQLMVKSIKAYSPFDRDEVLKMAASLEQNSSHLAAKAIVTAAIQQKLKLAKAKHVHEVPGLGVRASINGKEVLVGRFSLLEEYAVKTPATFKPSTVNHTAAFVAIEDRVAGVICLQDQIRPEAAGAIERLYRLGLKQTLMMTGDNKTTAEAITRQLGIEQVYAEALPADKLHILESLKHRPVAFVGDGVNDAPVLTAADVGIALGARGSAAASEPADMIIMLDDTRRVAGAYAIAKRTFVIARQSILAGSGLSLALMAIFATGIGTPLAGAFLQGVINIAVIFSALRASQITLNDT